MNILFIHQGFSGQYKHIIKELAKNDENNIVGLGITPLKETLPNGVKYYQYNISRGIHQEFMNGYLTWIAN